LPLNSWPSGDEDDQKVRITEQDLWGLWAPIHLAKEVGKGLGRGGILFKAVWAVQMIVKPLIVIRPCGNHGSF
jgi:hypothetical protein